MNELEIRIKPCNGEGNAEARRLCIDLRESCLTQLMRHGSAAPDDWLVAPPLPLAFWLLDNWWRIRWEPAPAESSAEWRLAHHLPSVGAGYPWPNVSLWGEGDRCAIAVHRDDTGFQRAVRFLSEPSLTYVPAASVEAATDAFIRAVLEDAGQACDGLDVEYSDLQAERSDPATSAWRKLEAMLGFDPDDAPEGLMSGYEEMAEKYGADGIEEAALAHKGEGSAQALKDSIEAAETSKLVLHAPSETKGMSLDHSSMLRPWRLAVDSAQNLRRRLAMPPGPIRNRRLSEVLGIRVERIARSRRPSADIPYGLRLRRDSGRGSKLALRSRWTHSLRFELCRSLGDSIWSGSDPLGPLSTAKSGRQKFQRAFAQEFLCPFDDLRDYIGTDKPTGDDIHAAARHFHVSEWLVQATLANNQLIDRVSFSQMVEAA